MSKVLFLDDNEARQEAFRKYAPPDTVIVSTAAECIAALQSKEDFHQVWLDHDLGGEVYVDSDREDCGMEVVRWLVYNKPEKFLSPETMFVIHSHNHYASEVMEDRLKQAGFFAIRHPFSVRKDGLIG